MFYFLSRLNRSISRLFTSTFLDECAFKGAYVMLLVPHYLVKIKEELKLKRRIFNHFLSILGTLNMRYQINLSKENKARSFFGHFWTLRQESIEKIGPVFSSYNPFLSPVAAI